MSSGTSEHNPAPPVPTPMSNFSFLRILLRDKLTRPNYLCYICAWRIILRYEKKEYVLDEEVLEELEDNFIMEENDDYDKHYNHLNEFPCIMLVTMVSELLKNFENLGASGMKALKEMFQE